MFNDRLNKSNLNLRTGTILLVVIILSLVSVSYALVSGIKKEDDHKKQETFTFYSGEKQDKYEAVFTDGELTKLSKNGKLLSKDEMKDKEDLVYDRINDLGNKNKEDFVFHFDNKKFKERMKHFGEEMKHIKPHIHMMLDSLNFNFDNLDINIDIPDIEMDEKDFNIDMDGINKELEKAAEEIKNSREEIAKLDINLKRSKKELKKLDQFLKDIKQEMVKDNLIKSSGDKIDLKIDDGEIYVNGKKLPDELAKKYKKLYKDKFGHNPHLPFELRSED